MSPGPQDTSAPSLADPHPEGLRRLLAHNDFIFAGAVAVVLATLLIPLPTFLLDMLLSCSIAVALAHSGFRVPGEAAEAVHVVDIQVDHVVGTFWSRKSCASLRTRASVSYDHRLCW